jgi:hypothetical protein
MRNISIEVGMADLAPEFCTQLSPIEVRDQVAAIDLGDYC